MILTLFIFFYTRDVSSASPSFISTKSFFSNYWIEICSLFGFANTKVLSTFSM